MSTMSKQEWEAKILKDVADIHEVMKKSGFPMEKAEGDDEIMDQAAGEPEMGAEGGAPVGEEGSAQEGAPEAPEAGEPAEAGNPEDDMAQVQEHAAQMSDEELQTMIEILSQELQGRQEQAQPQGEPDGDEGAPAPAAPAEEMQRSLDPAQKAKSADWSAMAKSVSAMAAAVESLGKGQAALQSKVDSLSKSAAAPAARPAPRAAAPAAHSRGTVLAKSSMNGDPTVGAPAEKMNKSQVETFLMNELRKSSSQRHPAINRDSMADLHYVSSQPELDRYVSKMTKEGVVFPK